MRFRPLWLALVLVALPSSVFADDHRAGVFFGASFASSSSLLGVHGALVYTPSVDQPRFGIVVADVSVHSGSEGDDDITRKSFMSGARVAFPLTTTSGGRHVPALQVLVGAVGSGTDDGTVAAGAISAQWDFIPRPHSDAPDWAFRVQADYVLVGDLDNYARVSAGVVYRHR